MQAICDPRHRCYTYSPREVSESPRRSHSFPGCTVGSSAQAVSACPRTSPCRVPVGLWSRSAALWRPRHRPPTTRSQGPVLLWLSKRPDVSATRALPGQTLHHYHCSCWTADHALGQNLHAGGPPILYQWARRSDSTGGHSRLTELPDTVWPWVALGDQASRLVPRITCCVHAQRCYRCSGNSSPCDLPGVTRKPLQKLP